MSSGFHSLIGTQVDRYLVLEQLGQGGFGAVYRARHTVIGTDVALKVLWPDHADDATSVERFLREARASASIGNEHIVHVVDAGRTAEGVVFLVMELLTGEDLEHAIETRGPFAISEAVEVAKQTLVALSAAHAHGIVHRDLKPANVFLTHKNGELFVKLLDFGISKMIGAKSLTMTGMVLGTPQYMAPEQLEGTRAVDARADLYAVGSIFYEMLAKRVPFEGASFDVIVRRLQGEQPPPITNFAPNVPPHLAAVAARALAPDRDARFESADAMVRALDGEMIPAGFMEQGVMTIPPRSAPPDGFAQQGIVTVPPRSAPPDVNATVPSGPPPAMPMSPDPSFPPPPRIPVEAAPRAPGGTALMPGKFVTPRPMGQPAVIPVTNTPARIVASSPVMQAMPRERSIHPAVYAAVGALAVLIALLIGAAGVAAWRRFMSEPEVIKPSASAPEDDQRPRIVVIHSDPPRADPPRGDPPPVRHDVIDEAPPPPSIDPTRIAYQLNVTGSRAPVDAVMERARPALARCAIDRPVHVAVHFIATLGGVISVSRPHPSRPSDDLNVAQCAAAAIQRSGPANLTGMNTAIVDADIDLPAREAVR